MQAESSQLKEFLTVYNKLTERCFKTCIFEFNGRQIVEKENSCLMHCVEKALNSNRRIMAVYAEDGRKPSEARRITCRLGVYQQADGSAYLEQGLTKVLVAVYGPHEIRNKGKARKEAEGSCIINCQYSMATFSTSDRKVRPRGDRKCSEARQQLEKVFQSAILLSSYPNSQIDIFCEIAMWGLAGAVSLGVSEKRMVVDTSHVEESSRTLPRLTIAALPRTQQILLLEMENRLHFDLLGSMMEAGLSAVGDVVAVLDTAVRNHVSDVATALGWTTQT